MRRAEVDAVVAELRADGLAVAHLYAGPRGYVVRVKRADGTHSINSREEANAEIAKLKAGRS